MKARIGRDGTLEIERAGKWREQNCRLSHGAYMCDDSCPLFNEGTHDELQDDESIRVRSVMLMCSALGPWHEITADARPKAGNA